MICLLFSVSTTLNAVNYNLESQAGYETQLIYENSGVYFCSLGNDKLIVNKLNENTKYTYSFDEQIIAYTVANKSVYILTVSDIQANTFYIYKATADKIKKCGSVYNINIGESTTFVADKNENFYLVDGKNNIIVINSKTYSPFDFKSKQLFSHNGKIYSVGNYEIKQISHNSVVKSFKYNDGFTKVISKNYICGNNNIFSLDNGITKIKSIENTSNLLVGESDKYIVEGYGNKLYAYDKQTGKITSKYEIGYFPIYLSVYRNTVYVVSKNNTDYMLNTYKADDIFKESITDSTNTAIDFKDFKIKGKYIFVDKGTTVAKFKSSISYVGYDAVFSKKSGNIGTNNTVTFSRNGNSSTYIFIVLGDLTGEGNVNSRDIYEIFGHLLYDKNLVKPFTISADLNCDNKISNIDLVMLARMSE
ncbi:MAG: dockerin type I domain-containing protein [Oscillospiraceae bacterium]|nr:dockerin type I domain-containing protein [Oscillospiraceae bacterium]